VKDRTESKRIILAWARKRTLPILVGDVALLLGSDCSLMDAEGLLGEMAAEGLLRALSEKERRSHDLRHGFVLV